MKFNNNKKIFIGILFFLSFFYSNTVNADYPETVIGVIDLNYILGNLTPLKKQLRKLKKLH